MIVEIDNAEADVPVFGKSVQKFSKCKYGASFMGQRSCSVFHHAFDNSMDILHHCGSCKLNVAEPTTKKINVRFF